MKKLKFIIALCILVSISIGGYVVYKKVNVGKPKQLLLQFEESFPNMKMVNSEGNEVNTDDIFINKTTLIFYGSKDCSWCISSLKFMKFCINNSIISEHFNIIYMWEDEIPGKHLEMNGIPYNINYSLDNKYVLSDIAPSFFIIKENKVIFATNETEKMINKIINSVDIRGLRESVLKDLYSSTENKDILFVSEECEECQLIKENIDMNQFITISNYDMENAIIDKYMFFSKILTVNTYPSLLIENNETYSILIGYDNIINYKNNDSK